jgi:hypothetical protein
MLSEGTQLLHSGGQFPDQHQLPYKEANQLATQVYLKQFLRGAAYCIVMHCNTAPSIA